MSSSSGSPCSLASSQTPDIPGGDGADALASSQGPDRPGRACWTKYFTREGLPYPNVPYYHNHSTGETQWELPAEVAN